MPEYDERFFDIPKAIEHSKAMIASPTMANVVKWGLSTVIPIFHRAAELQKAEVHAVAFGTPEIGNQVCSCGLRLHHRPLTLVEGHRDIHGEIAPVFMTTSPNGTHKVICQDCGVQARVDDPTISDLKPHPIHLLKHRSKCKAWKYWLDLSYPICIRGKKVAEDDRTRWFVFCDICHREKVGDDFIDPDDHRLIAQMNDHYRDHGLSPEDY